MWLKEKIELLLDHVEDWLMHQREVREQRRWLAADDKRDMVYYGFIGSCIAIACASVMTSFAIRVTTMNDLKEFEEALNTVSAFMVCSTDDEYEEITQELRRSMAVRSLCPEDMEVINLIPNSAEQCVIDSAKENLSGQVFLVALNTGVLYDLDVIPPKEQLLDEENYGYFRIVNGYDEISRTSFTIAKDPNAETTKLSIGGESKWERTLSILRVKALFCEDCINMLATVLEDSYLPQVVLLDCESNKVVPISEGTLELGAYNVKTIRETATGNYSVILTHKES